jgi:hypothetical protein
VGCREARKFLGGEDEGIAVIAEPSPYGVFQVDATVPAGFRDYCQVDIAPLARFAAGDGAKENDGLDIVSDDLCRSLGEGCHRVEE